MANLIRAFLSRMPAGASLMCISTDDIVTVQRASLREHLASVPDKPSGEVRAEDLDLPGYSVRGAGDGEYSAIAPTWVPENRWNSKFGKFYPNGHAPYDLAVSWMQRDLSANITAWPKNVYAVFVHNDDDASGGNVRVLIETDSGLQLVGDPTDAERAVSLWHVRVPHAEPTAKPRGRLTYAEASLALVRLGVIVQRTEWPTNKIVQWNPEPGKDAASFKPPMNYSVVQETVGYDFICTTGPLTPEDLAATDWYISFRPLSNTSNTTSAPVES